MAADRPEEACGVFGIFDHEAALRLSVDGIFALQHRGQESAGLAIVDDNGQLHVVKGMGLVNVVLTTEALQGLSGQRAISHTRYSTSGSSIPENAQPFLFRVRGTSLALCHNGNLVNAFSRRRELEQQGALFQTTTDTEVVAHVLAHQQAPDLEQALRSTLTELVGGYAILLLTRDALYGVRDPAGIRPLVFGRVGDAFALASESCALQAVGGVCDGEVEPGELIRIDAAGLHREQLLPAVARALCSFEHIYFARADSEVGGQPVFHVREALGRELAKEHPVEADVVVGVPDSSLPAASGFAEALGLPLAMGLVKSRYVARTFIEPGAKERQAAVRLKLSAVAAAVKDKRVALVDDSLVRGTTSRHLVEILRQAGAKAVHVRIASPPYRHPCHYGIDTSAQEDLLAHGRTVEDIRDSIGADSLGFLSVEAVERAMGGGGCFACFTGTYPVPVDLTVRKTAGEEDDHGSVSSRRS